MNFHQIKIKARIALILVVSAIINVEIINGQVINNPGIPNLPEFQKGYKFVPEFEINNDWLIHYLDSSLMPFAESNDKSPRNYNFYFCCRDLINGKPGEVVVTITLEKTDSIPRIAWDGFCQIGPYLCFGDETFIKGFAKVGDRFIKMVYDGTPARGFNHDNVKWRCFFIPTDDGKYEIVTYGSGNNKRPKLSSDGKPYIGVPTDQELFWDTGIGKISED